MPTLICLVGPPGSGKSTLAKTEFASHVYVNQDSQGKQGQWEVFETALEARKDVVVDRMGFNKEQRGRYIGPARKAGYDVKIVVLHVPREVCLARCLQREGHETIKDEVNANSALTTFFTKYERPTSEEGELDFRYPLASGRQTDVVIVDIDGTIANTDHRLHFMKGPKKNWPGFFGAMDKDEPNDWCLEIVRSLIGAGRYNKIIFCSGRPDNYREITENWLWRECDLVNQEYLDEAESDDEKWGHDTYEHLFMRPFNDSRKDDLIKEIILDFEILARGYKPIFAIDDRTQVVELWRRRGLVCLQCEKGDF